jgi:hypothetical protein
MMYSDARFKPSLSASENCCIGYDIILHLFAKEKWRIKQKQKMQKCALANSLQTMAIILKHENMSSGKVLLQRVRQKLKNE